MSLHCPKCGVSFTRSSKGALVCVPGNMELSARLQQQFTAIFVENIQGAQSKPLGFRVGGSWFCPACAVPTIEKTPGEVRCPQCNRTLSEFIPELVELHPHVPPNKSLERTREG
jgi:uncharacterized Zn finger protein (UPF0148 family)